MLLLVTRTLLSPYVVKLGYCFCYRTGCRPLLEVKCGSQLVVTTSTEYERMREFTVADGTVRIPIKPSVLFGDVCIIVSHARSSLGTKIQGKVRGSLKLPVINSKY